jgi:uncharacterized protein YndB with AHSA1/START domain
MVRGSLSWCALGLLSATAAAAQGSPPSWRDFPGVANSSFVEPGGDRAIQLSIEVPAPPGEVFRAFATTEGFRSWAAPVARVDFRVGGSIEASYDPSVKLGSADTIRNQIVAYVPDRLLVIRNVQAPRNFVHPELFQRTVTVIEFAPAAPGRTRVTVTNVGYGAGPDFDGLYRHFEWGDAYTLAGLKRRFEKGPVDWSKPEPTGSAAAADDRFKGGK